MSPLALSRFFLRRWIASLYDLYAPEDKLHVRARLFTCACFFFFFLPPCTLGVLICYFITPQWTFVAQKYKSALRGSRRRPTCHPDPIWHHVGHTNLQQLLLYIIRLYILKKTCGIYVWIWTLALSTSHACKSLRRWGGSRVWYVYILHGLICLEDTFLVGWIWKKLPVYIYTGMPLHQHLFSAGWDQDHLQIYRWIDG